MQDYFHHLPSCNTQQPYTKEHIEIDSLKDPLAISAAYLAIKKKQTVCTCQLSQVRQALLANVEFVERYGKDLQIKNRPYFANPLHNACRNTLQINQQLSISAGIFEVGAG